MLDRVDPPKYFQFVEADVDNLYPSINIDDGLNALYTFLTTRSKFPQSRIQFLIKLTQWVLTNNYIKFGDKMFLQLQGTAMGTPCAVIFACVYMHTLEQEALDIFASQRYIYNCLFLFFRFIDDIIAVVSDYSTGFALMELLNSRRSNIKLSFKIRNMESQFLDLTLYKERHESTTIAVKAYSKPMNKFLFLPPTSCHPQHIFQGWIIGYGKRLRLNCSQDSEFEKSLSDFNARLLQRGYEQQCITDAYSKIPSRNTILNTLRTTPDSSTTPSSSIGVPFVLTYTPSIRQSLPLLKAALAFTEEAHLDPDFPLIFGKRSSPLLSFRRGPSLRDLIAPSTLS